MLNIEKLFRLYTAISDDICAVCVHRDEHRDECALPRGCPLCDECAEDLIDTNALREEMLKITNSILEELRKL